MKIQDSQKKAFRLSIGMAEEKQAYVSSPLGELDITLIRDAHPCVQITIDLGIPNFTVFSLKYPLIQGETRAMTELTYEALAAVLDDITAFMLNLKFSDEVCTLIYSCVLNCFKGLSMDSDAGYTEDHAFNENMVQTYRGTFSMPLDFVDETYDRVVTASSVLHRVPPTRKLLMTPFVPPRSKLNEAARVIRMFRNKVIRQQPRPMYLVLYDQTGRPAAAQPYNRFKNKLLRGF